MVNKSGDRVSVTRTEYTRMVGDRTTRAYIAKVYNGRMTPEEVPEELREAVEAAVAARTEFSGEFRLPDKEALEILMGGTV